MEQTERIAKMEERLDRAAAGLARLDEALDGLAALREDVSALAAYYEGPLWREDFEADEAGLLPQELKRGVLSEDAVYDLLTAYDALMEKLREAR